MTAEKVKMQMDRIIVNTEARLLAVTRQSIQGVIEDEMQKPKEKGGRMRVKTGFLRSSGVAALNERPKGPSKGDKNSFYDWTGESLQLVLAKMKLGDTFYFGWSANYAKYREFYDGFMLYGLSRFQNHVDKAVRFFRNKDMSK